MGIRIKAPYGLDRVVKQIDPKRRRRPHRIHIEQRAAYRVFTRARNLADAHIAGFDQPLAEGIELQRFADRELKRPPLNVVAGRQPLHQHIGCHDQAARLQARQLEERAQPLRGDVRVRREQVVRQHFPVGQCQQWQPLAREELQLGGQPLELAGIVGDDDI